jgi:transposase-like protein
MAQKRARRRFTREYKAQAVQRVIESGLPLADIAAELAVSPGQLSQWRHEQWTSLRGVEGSVKNPSTPGERNGTQTTPETVYAGV